MAYYNKDQSGNNDSGKDVWQRQNDVLEHLKNAEQEIFKGIELQNPVYDLQYGAMRNHYSVTTLLSGARKYHFIIQSLLTDEKGTGINSEKNEIYKQAFEKVTSLVNQSVNLGTKTPLGSKKLEEAYRLILETIYALREEVSISELDFKKKKSVYEAWKD